MRKVKRTKYGDYELRVKFPVFRGYTIHIVIGEDLENSIQARYPEHLESEDDQHTSAMTIKAQERWAHTQSGQKALGKQGVKEWDNASKGKKLPEKAKIKSKFKSK